jgi:hypothetical protein
VDEILFNADGTVAGVRSGKDADAEVRASMTCFCLRQCYGGYFGMSNLRLHFTFRFLLRRLRWHPPSSVTPPTSLRPWCVRVRSYVQ